MPKSRAASNLSVEDLKTQLASLEQEAEQAKAVFHRCVGAAQVLKVLIAKAETLEQPEK